MVYIYTFLYDCSIIQAFQRCETHYPQRGVLLVQYVHSYVDLVKKLCSFVSKLHSYCEIDSLAQDCSNSSALAIQLFKIR